MDEVKSQKMVPLIQSIKAQNFLIRVTQLLVSLCLFSFIFSSSSLVSFFHYFNFYLSTIPFQLFTHTIDKNCIFLLCNGLLVFVGITKSLSRSSCVDESYKYIEDGPLSPYSSNVEANESMFEKINESRHQDSEAAQMAYSSARKLVASDSEATHTIEIKYSSEEGEEKVNEDIHLEEEEGKGSHEGPLVLVQEEEQDGENGLLEAGDEERELEVDEFFIEESVEEEEVVEEANWVLTNEELNKKFDDFIRRMKEDLRIEAQRQLLMV